MYTEITPDTTAMVKREYVMLTEWQNKQVFASLELASAMVIESGEIKKLVDAIEIVVTIVENEIWFSGTDADGDDFHHTEQFERVDVFFPAFPR